MLRIKQKITNPMTVIAIFAILSETSAAVSLPFLDNEDREIYVWFLISFPFYLLFLFLSLSTSITAHSTRPRISARTRTSSKRLNIRNVTANENRCAKPMDRALSR